MVEFSVFPVCERTKIREWPFEVPLEGRSEGCLDINLLHNECLENREFGATNIQGVHKTDFEFSILYLVAITKSRNS